MIPGTFMVDSDFVIRLAVPGDAPVIGSLATELGYPNNYAETADRLRRVLASPGHMVLLAETAQQTIIGWVHVFGAVRVESDAFAELGGVPQQILYDRMKNVYIGKIAGKKKFNDTLVGFALHYGFKPEVAPAYAAWVKGKVERPYNFIREGFWRGYGFICLDTANGDLTSCGIIQSA